MPIGRSEVEHVARLARLELTQDELDVMLAQLARIVEYVDKLSLLNVDSIQPMMHASEGCPLREDEPEPTLPRKTALEGAPASSEGFFRVPRVIE